MRLKWIDLAKGIAIVLVVWRHVITGLESNGIHVDFLINLLPELTRSFRVPFFFILSGIFFRKSIEKRSFDGFVANKISTLLYPYFVWASIQLLIQISFSNYTTTKRNFADFIYLVKDPHQLDQMWFLVTLFNAALVYLILYKILNANKLLLGLVGILFLFFARLNITPIINDVFSFFIYIAAGDIIAPFLFSDKKMSRVTNIKFFLPFTILFFVVQYFYINYGVSDNFVLSLIAITGGLYFIGLCYIIQEIRFVDIVRFVGKNSIYIYIFHVTIASLLRLILVKFLGFQSDVLLVVLITTLAVLISVAGLKIIKRFHLEFLIKANLDFLLPQRK